MLKSKRLKFLSWHNEDLPRGLELWGDPEVLKYTDKRKKLDEAEVQARIHSEITCLSNYSVQYWPIYTLDKEDFIGCCGLHPYAKERDVYELGFHILRKHWRNGYAFEAAQTVVQFAFDKLLAKYLFAGHHPDNEGSRKILEKLGFSYVRDEHYQPSGLTHRCYELYPSKGQ